MRLLQWRPDFSAVTSLKVDTGDKPAAISPDVLKRAIPMLQNLTTLKLHGRKVTAAVLAVAAKQPFVSKLH
eukprot:6871526-Prymnesium_polylepis.1